MTIDFPAWLAATQAQAETAVERYLPTTSTGQDTLHEAMSYVSVVASVSVLCWWLRPRVWAQPKQKP